MSSMNLPEALEALDALTCGANGCTYRDITKPASGMGTNGGCECYEALGYSDRKKMRQALVAVVRAARAEVGRRAVVGLEPVCPYCNNPSERHRTTCPLAALLSGR